MSEEVRLRVMFNSDVQAMPATEVAIETDGSIESIPNDAVVMCTGGILRSAFLRTIGIHVDTEWGTE